MKKPTKKLQQELKQHHDLLKDIDKVIENIHVDIEKERGKDPPTEASLNLEIKKLIVAKDQVKNKINKLKTVCAKRKDEILEWQHWFDKIEEVDKSAEKKQLDAEVNRRFKEITEKESEISRLYLENQEFAGKIEAKKIQLEAIKAGVHLLPPEEDPRLKEVLSKKQRILAKMDQLKNQ
jgi:hypothetical protein